MIIRLFDIKYKVFMDKNGIEIGQKRAVFRVKTNKKGL
jgi:hypothetical protein